MIFSKSVKARQFHKLLQLSIKYAFSIPTVKQILLHKILSCKHDYAIREVNGFKMILNLKDEGISKDLFIYGIREPFTTNYLLTNKIIQKGGVIFDVGANIGYYVLIESRLTGKCGRVFAFEPVPENYSILIANLYLNQAKNVFALPFAIGENYGYKPIYITEKMNLSTLNPQGIQAPIKHTCPVITYPLDFFTKNITPPNLIRMDVEGYEYEIFKGMEKTLTYKPKILIEIHGNILTNQQLNHIFKTLENHNYKVEFAVRDGYCTTKTAKILNPNLNTIKIKTTNLKKLKLYIQKTKKPIQTLLTPKEK